MKTSSVVSSIRSTVPCAGDTIALGIDGVFGVGSRKKYNVNTAKTPHSATSAVVTAAIMEPTIVASTPAAKITASRINVQTMILKAALRAFPECFIIHTTVPPFGVIAKGEDYLQ